MRQPSIDRATLKLRLTFVCITSLALTTFSLFLGVNQCGVKSNLPP